MLRNKLLIASLCPHIIMAADKQADIKSETLLHSGSAWNGVSYEAYSKGAVELSVLRITIPPHSKLKWHAHPMPNAAYIISGEITLEQEGVNKERHFVAGQVVPKTVNTLQRGNGVKGMLGRKNILELVHAQKSCILGRYSTGLPPSHLPKCFWDI